MHYLRCAAGAVIARSLTIQNAYEIIADEVRGCDSVFPE